MSNWVSVSQAVAHYGVSEKTLYTRIKSNQIKSKLESNRRWVYIEIRPTEATEATEATEDIVTEATETNVRFDKTALEVEHLKEKLDLMESQTSDYKKQVNDYKDQVTELLKQNDQGQQLAAMQQQTIDKLTEQNQLLLEANQEKGEKKVSFWGRLVGQRA